MTPQILSIIIVLLCCIVLLVYILVRQHKRYKIFLFDFAQTHNLTYRKNVEVKDITSFSARLVNYRTTIISSDALEGEYNGHSLLIFTHSFYPRKYSISLKTFTISVTDFDKTQFPHILLRNKKVSHYQSRNNTKDREIKLEKEYSDYQLMCTEGYEIEVLQIFTTDLLNLINKIEGKFSIEFGDNKIYIYLNKVIKDEKTMENILNITTTIIDNSGELLKRLHDDFEVMHHYLKK